MSCEETKENPSVSVIIKFDKMLGNYFDKNIKYRHLPRYKYENILDLFGILLYGWL